MNGHSLGDVEDFTILTDDEDEPIQRLQQADARPDGCYNMRMVLPRNQRSLLLVYVMFTFTYCRLLGSLEISLNFLFSTRRDIRPTLGGGHILPVHW